MNLRDQQMIANAAKSDFDQILADLDALADAKTLEAVHRIQKDIQDCINTIDLQKSAAQRNTDAINRDPSS